MSESISTGSLMIGKFREEEEEVPMPHCCKHSAAGGVNGVGEEVGALP